jgi:hypothetical protein
MTPLGEGATTMAHAVGTAGRACAVLAPAALLVVLALIWNNPAAAQVRGREPVVGLPCEGCGAIFVDLPDSLSFSSRIAPEDEPGEPMVIEGTVFDQEGRPAPGVIVYGYHTNAAGIYPQAARLRGTEASSHGRLRGWVRTDEEGRYRFRTIRPGAYPSRDNPEHVHMHVLEVGCCTYYLASIKFTDDPLLSGADREAAREGRGGNALVTPRRTAEGVWLVQRDIYLGRGVPGYPGRSARAP